jgi:hypothetical protein
MKIPKARWKVQGGRVVFDGLIGKVELPPVGDLTQKAEGEA